MQVLQSEWKDRIEHWIRVMKSVLYEPLGEIRWDARRTMEYLSPEQISQEAFAPAEPGFTWGNTWEYCWFRAKVQLPREADGRRIVMALDPGGEATLFVNGKAFGTYRSDWLDVIHEKHHFLEDNVLTRCGKVGETFDILMEVYAGHDFPQWKKGCCCTGPVLPEEDTKTLPEGARRTLGRCTYGVWNEDAYQLYMDASTLWRLFQVLEPSSLRAAEIAKALKQFTLIVDFEQEKEKRDASFLEARALLKPLLEAKCGDTQPVFYLVGNAHLDLAWLWPMQETERKTARTLAAQLRLLEEYPEYRFIQSQPASYEMCREHYPELFDRIRKAAQTGQWIADGAMWVEPDTNLSGGESLIRQFLYGKQYYQEEFGKESRLLWLPDSFGYSAALPQILKGCGVDYLVTQKIFWTYNEEAAFPYHYFTWKGMDGSEVTAFLPTSYTYYTDPETLNNVWKSRRQAEDLDAFLIPFGYGDGGGGPSRDFIEYARRQENLEGGVKVKLAGPMEFFEDMDAKGGPKHTYTGELYFTAHRGTYTSQANMKKNNRRNEFALRELELWASAAFLQGMAYPAREIETLWKQVLLYQFHDILPGSCIGRVYEEADQACAQIRQENAILQDQVFRYLIKAGQKKPESGINPENSMVSEDDVTVFNSLWFARNVWVQLPETYKKGAVLRDGTVLETKPGKDGCQVYVQVPACGAVSLRPAVDEEGSGKCPLPRETAWGQTGEIYVLDNGIVRAVIDKKGELTSFVLLHEEQDSTSDGEEFISGRGNHFLMYKDVPRLFDAWDIDSNYLDQETDGAFDLTVQPVCSGTAAALRVTGKIGKSEFTQTIRLESGSRRLEFDTQIEWRELHRLLKVAFPVNVYTENGINEIQFGYVKRPTHRSRPFDKARFEVCNHRYSALCDAHRGAAVLNDCKYGISMNENRLELSLLRAASSPQMRADNGTHHFTYAFTAWTGDFYDSDVVRQGYELNTKPAIVTGGCLDFSLFHVDAPNIVIETVKCAEDGSGDLILRLYESKKAAGPAKLWTQFLIREAWECDMLESRKTMLEEDGQKIPLRFRAFEIKTIRIRLQ